MITLERCKEWLERQNGVEQVEVVRGEFVSAKFANHITPDEPHSLVVHPVVERQVLKVVVPHIAKTKSNVQLLRTLSHITYDILLGKVGVDSDGEVRFEVNQACVDGASEDPSQEIFARLVEVAINETRKVAFVSTYWGMIEAGVPEAVAKRFVSQFCQQESAGDGEKTL